MECIDLMIYVTCASAEYLLLCHGPSQGAKIRMGFTQKHLHTKRTCSTIEDPRCKAAVFLGILSKSGMVWKLHVSLQIRRECFV